MYDIIIIGSGPAGLSAAITARIRGKSVLVVSNDRTKAGLYKAKSIENYPGIPAITGAELSDKLYDHAAVMGAKFAIGRVSTILRVGSIFNVGYGMETATAKCLILATGIMQSSEFPGEQKLLGRGVSYCATCDGMLYRGKRVCVVCLSDDAEAEAEYLTSIGCLVTKIKSNKIAVNGDDRVSSITADNEEIPCDGVFILRKTILPATLIPGLNTQDNRISVDQKMQTNLPAIFAAGDCTGTPHQIAKAVGEGQVAVLSATDLLDKVTV